jgi:hypothetical protein
VCKNARQRKPGRDGDRESGRDGDREPGRDRDRESEKSEIQRQRVDFINFTYEQWCPDNPDIVDLLSPY